MEATELKPTVVIVDDRDEMRDAVEKTIGEDFDVVASVSSGEDLVEVLTVAWPDAAVIDIHMNGISGLEALRKIAKPKPPAVVMLTTSSDPQFVQEALSHGALGYVLKGAAASDLIPALHAALRGEVFVSSCVSEPMSRRAGA